MERRGLQAQAERSRRPALVTRFLRGRSGVAAIEFALIAVPFIGLLAAIFETALVFFVQESFENSVNNVARQVLVNDFESNSTPTAASFKSSTFCPSLPSYFDCGKVVLNVQAVNPATSNFAGVAAGLTTNWYKNPTTNLNLGQPGWIVYFQAFYPMPVYLSVLIATGVNGQGIGNFYDHASGSIYANPNGSGFVHAIFTTVVFRNEP